MAMRWYAVQTYTGQEAKVKAAIDELKVSEDMQDIVGDCLNPTQDVIQVKNGKKIKTTRKFFPSYVLVELELNKESEYFIRSVNGVSGFVGGIKPQPLKEDEVRRIVGTTAEGESRQEISEVPFEVGDAVRIQEGPFKDFDGVIDEVHAEKGKVKVMVSVFGRSTPVEVDFVQVSPVN